MYIIKLLYIIVESNIGDVGLGDVIAVAGCQSTAPFDRKPRINGIE